MKKKYLTEVEFVDGVEEFKSYRDFTKKVVIDSEEDFSSFEIEIDALDINFESISVEIEGKYEIPVAWRKVTGKDVNTIEVYLIGGQYLNKGDVIVLKYVALNRYISDLYSVDYDNGILYFANESNVAFNCNYSYYNMQLKGDRAEQLTTDEYSTQGDVVSINNKLDNYKYITVYSEEEKESQVYTTPVIKNIKVNYINTSEEESF